MYLKFNLSQMKVLTQNYRCQPKKNCVITFPNNFLKVYILTTVLMRLTQFDFSLLNEGALKRAIQGT